MTRLMSVRSPQQLLDANVDLLKGEMQRFFDGQARLSQLSAEAALDAKQRIEDATSALKQGGTAAGDRGVRVGPPLNRLDDSPAIRPKRILRACHGTDDLGAAGAARPVISGANPNRA